MGYHKPKKKVNEALTSKEVKQTVALLRDLPLSTRGVLVKHNADKFAKLEPKFNKELFYNACGVPLNESSEPILDDQVAQQMKRIWEKYCAKNTEYAHPTYEQLSELHKNLKAGLSEIESVEKAKRIHFQEGIWPFTRSIAFNVYKKNKKTGYSKKVDTVFYPSDWTEGDVKREIINSKGFDSNIVVMKESINESNIGYLKYRTEKHIKELEHKLWTAEDNNDEEAIKFWSTQLTRAENLLSTMQPKTVTEDVPEQNDSSTEDNMVSNIRDALMFLKMSGNTKVPTSVVMNEFENMGIQVSLEQLQELFPEGNDLLKSVNKDFIEFNFDYGTPGVSSSQTSGKSVSDLAIKAAAKRT